MLYKGFYLVELSDGLVTSTDGSHSRKTGVTEALKLYQKLGFYKVNKVYKMVHLKEDIPSESAENGYLILTNLTKEKKLKLLDIVNKNVKINEEAVAICKEMIDLYGQRF